MITFTSKGSFKNTRNFLTKAPKKDLAEILERYGALGVERLKEATPVDTGKTANSWYYSIEHDLKGITITWHNDNLDDQSKTPIVMLLEYGHGTSGGAWVSGRHFIEPAAETFFNEMAASIWKEVTNL